MKKNEATITQAVRRIIIRIIFIESKKRGMNHEEFSWERAEQLAICNWHRQMCLHL